MGCGKEGQVKLVKTGSQMISPAVMDEMRSALSKDHLELVVETAS